LDRVTEDFGERDPIETMHTVAQQEHLSQSRLDRINKAERIVAKRQATIALGSHDVGFGSNRRLLKKPIHNA
jgi:hypothetical protein